MIHQLQARNKTTISETDPGQRGVQLENGGCLGEGGTDIHSDSPKVISPLSTPRLGPESANLHVQGPRCPFGAALEGLHAHITQR